MYVEALTVVGEERADVNTTSKAPNNWGIWLRSGLKRGINIYAIAQRWSEADKTAVGNASDFVIFRNSSGDDVRYLSRKTRIPELQIDELEQLHYVWLDALTGKNKKGKLRW